MSSDAQPIFFVLLRFAEGRFDDAGAAYENASLLAPDNMEIMFWHAVTLVSKNEVDRSLPILEHVFEIYQRWRELIPRLVSAELFPDDKEIITRVLKQ